MGPIVIGGVGGSGTRVVTEILQKAGIFMGSDQNAARDYLGFTLLFKRPQWFIQANPEEIQKALQILEKSLLGQTPLQGQDYRIIYRAVTDKSRFRHGGSWKRRARRRTRLLRSAFLLANPPGQFDSQKHRGWGWKEPNTCLYIDYLSQCFSDLHYILVIRHGLDMAYSNNRQQLLNFGGLFGVAAAEEAYLLPKSNLQYWIVANENAISLGQKLLGERLLVLNFDQLCFEPEKNISRLLKFVGSSADNADSGAWNDMIKPPASLGRYKSQDPSLFSEDEIEAVRRLGFPVELS